MARRLFLALISLAVASLFAQRLDAADLEPKFPVLVPVAPPPPAFIFEAGLRYWYSSGNIRWGFHNNSPLFGNPTSTIDWQGYTSHSGEAFARVDHVPSGFFVKGMLGLGNLRNGSMDDRDFLRSQFVFSDTSSRIGGNSFSYGTFDIGVTYQPYADVRVGAFVGYQFWREKLTAYGIQCNQSDLGILGVCIGSGGVPIPFNVAVMSYEPTWHAVRVGVEGRLVIDGNWSVSGEVAAIPYARLENKDSHLLRQGADELGPAPNIITRAPAYGVAAELFINYAITANWEVGAGARYWGLFATGGDVDFGPAFNQSFGLNRFEQQRFGILLELKGRL